MVILKRFKIKDRFGKMGIVFDNESICVMCGKEEESFSYLFIYCCVDNVDVICEMFCGVFRNYLMRFFYRGII